VSGEYALSASLLWTCTEIQIGCMWARKLERPWRNFNVWEKFMKPKTLEGHTHKNIEIIYCKAGKCKIAGCQEMFHWRIQMYKNNGCIQHAPQLRHHKWNLMEWSEIQLWEELAVTYCGMQAHCYATTMKEATIQQPLLSTGFTNKHMCMVTIRNSKWGMAFSVQSVLRCYKQDKLEDAVR
jgi:hypothetical protein